MSFTDRLLLLIEQKGVSKNKMLTDLCLGKNSFVNWETRHNIPDGETLLKIARYFDVSVDFLLGNESTNIVSVPDFSPEEMQELNNYIEYIRSKRK